MNNACDMHHNEKKKKFCKETTCWERLCNICAQERHNGHNIVDYSTILAEVKAERERSAMNKGRTLVELKKALANLDRMQKSVKDGRIKMKEKERKLRIQIESQMKNLAEIIALQQGKAQRILDGAIEEVNAKKSELGRIMSSIERIVEQIIINGDGYNIHKFFEMCSNDCSIKLEELMSGVEKEFNLFQELEKKLSINDISSIARSSSPKLSSTPCFGRLNSKNKTNPLEKSPPAQFRSPNKKNGDLTSKLVKLTSLGPLRSPSLERSATELRLESLKKSIQQATSQMQEKKSALKRLDTLMISKSKDIEILEQKRGNLLKANDSLREHLEMQNRIFENSTRTLGLSPTSRTCITSMSTVSLTRSPMTPSGNSIRKKAPPLNLDIIQNNVFLFSKGSKRRLRKLQRS